MPTDNQPQPQDALEVLTAVALPAARDCKSRKTKRRLRAAMYAVLTPEHNGATLEVRLMGAIAATIKVIDDVSAENLQRELYGLGRLSTLMNNTPEGELPDEKEMEAIQNDMPRDVVGILVIWHECVSAAKLCGDVPEDAS